MTPEELGLPPTSAHREEAIIKAVVEDGDYDPVEWVPLVLDDRLEVMVMADSLKLKGVRLNVTAETAQHIADSFGACLPTAKILDQMWLQREVTLPPFPQPITSSTEGMIRHSQAIDSYLNADDYGKRVSTLGKHWIIDRDIEDRQKIPNQAINYGWHWTNPNEGGVTATQIKNPNTGMYVRMIQSRGWHHNIHHVDYSQILRLVALDCTLDGELADLSDILTDPELFGLALSNKKPLKSHRHPFVEQRYVGATIFGTP